VEFRNDQAIYRQIAVIMCENVLSRAWKPGERIPSIRETAEASQVNPNTVTRTYAYLEQLGIIRNQRGVGFFLSDDAYEITRRISRADFEKSELPRVFRIMDLLSIGIAEFETIYDAHRGASGKEKAL
jgi:DNA-binding transcriptional regulator YhcF (GntR family)